MAQVLRVEDDAVIRTSLTRALRDLGHGVASTGSGMPALGQAVEPKPDVVLLDLGRPDLDGSDVLSMLRAVSDVPVIIATARDDVVKPFSAAQGNALIRAALRRSGKTGEGPVITVGGLRIGTRSYEVGVSS